MKHRNVKARLIEQTISVMATEGLDKTTTKAIVRGSDIPEAYIYQYFNNKEELLASAFELIDGRLCAGIIENLSVMYVLKEPFEIRCREFFHLCWRLFNENGEQSAAYLQYYYSPYYRRHSEKEHILRYAPLVKRFSRAFEKSVRVDMLLEYMLTVSLGFAVKADSDSFEAKMQTESTVFSLIYHSLYPYFRQAFETGREVCRQ